MKNLTLKELHPEIIPHISICYWGWKKKQKTPSSIREVVIKSYNTNKSLLNSNYKLTIPFTV